MKKGFILIGIIIIGLISGIFLLNYFQVNEQLEICLESTEPQLYLPAEVVKDVPFLIINCGLDPGKTYILQIGENDVVSFSNVSIFNFTYRFEDIQGDGLVYIYLIELERCNKVLVKDKELILIKNLTLL